MQNPLRSEAAMFRLLLVIAVAAAVVIAVALVVGTLAGVIVLVAELAAGGWYLVRELS